MFLRLAIIGVLFAPLSGAAQEVYQTPPEAGEALAPTITAQTPDGPVTLAGRLYREPHRHYPLPAGRTVRGSAEQAARADFSAWSSGATDFIISGFVPTEHEKVRNFLSDVRARRVAVESHQMFEFINVHGEASWGDVTLLFVSYGEAQRGKKLLAFKQSSFAWQRSTAPLDDPEIRAIERAWQRGNIK